MTGKARDNVSVERVTDYSNENQDLRKALELYEARIEFSEQEGGVDHMIRQFQVGAQKRAAGEYHFEDYVFVAKLGSEVCGIMVVYFDPKETFAFVAYLVVREGLTCGDTYPGSTMCKEVAGKLEQALVFGEHDRIFLELDDPRFASGKEQRKEGIARIRRFDEVCNLHHMHLRFLDFDYRQAQLDYIPDELGQELPLLLGYVSRKPEASMDDETVRRVLRLIYTRLNPEG